MLESNLPTSPLPTGSLQIDKQQVASAFGRAAHSYEQHNELQRRTGNTLLSLLTQTYAHPVARGLDLGCGSGWFLQALSAKAKQLVALDLSPAMLQQARLKLEPDAGLITLCADMDMPVLALHSLDFIFANLCLQWSQDPAAWLTNWSQRLTPGGVLVFATLIEGSLDNLAQCWQHQGLPSPINHFITGAQLEHYLAATGYEWQCHYACEQLAFPNLTSLLHSLKGIGANRVNGSRRSGLMGKQRWQQLNLTYPNDRHGHCVADYQLAYGVIYG